MSIFGQVWLWSLLAFVVGALLTWLVLVLPVQKRIRLLESRLATAHAESIQATAQPSEATGTAYLAGSRTAEPYVEAEPELEAWTQQPALGHEPALTGMEPEATEYIHRPDTAYEPEPEMVESVATDHIPHPDTEVSRTAALTSGSAPAAPESLFQPQSAAGDEREPHWFDRTREVGRSVPEGPPAAHYAEAPEVTEGPRPETRSAAETSAHGFEPDEQRAPGDAETPLDATQVLPKRQRRESPRGGFDSPRPIQPSMRTVERRESSPEATGGHSGSLFEPAVQPSQFTASPPEPPPARQQTFDPVPPGPFGPGSAMPRPGGGRPSAEFGVKASVTALRYCTEESAQFPRMVAEVWFRTAADAERVGFRPLG